MQPIPRSDGKYTPAWAAEKAKAQAPATPPKPAAEPTDKTTPKA